MSQKHMSVYARRLAAFCCLLIVGPGSFLLFIPIGSSARVFAEMITWCGAIGCLLVGALFVLLKLREVLWRE